MNKKEIMYLKDLDMWNDDDRQVALDYLNSNKEEKDNLIKIIREDHMKPNMIDFMGDGVNLINVINSGRTESFILYDSVLMDYFWYYFNKYILNKESFKGSLFEQCYDDTSVK